MSEFVKRLARLPSDRRSEFLRQLMAQTPGAASREPKLVRTTTTGPAPASFAQEQLWFLDQLAPGKPTYNVPFCVRLRGRLDTRALIDALRTVAQRHEVLRSRLAMLDGRLVQLVEPVDELAVPIVEATDPARIQSLVAAHARRSFELATGPLVRALLVRESASQHLLVLTVHHIAFDGWSFPILGRELSACYNALVRGARPELAELPVQYADYAAWQRERLAGPLLDRLTSYWRRALDGAPVLELPTDRPRPARLTFDGAVAQRLMPAELADGLHAFAARRGTTLFPVLLSGLATVMYHYSGQDDVVLGAPSANRARPELEGLIGFFVNMLALRTRIGERVSFAELVDQVHGHVLDAYAHQELPFEKVVDAIRATRDPNRSPIFQVVLALQNAGGHEMSFDGLAAEVTPVHVGTSRFDISVNVTEGPAGLAVDAEYNTNLFTEQTVQRLLRHFEQLLRTAVAEPDRPVRRLSVLGDDERRQMLLAWNDTAAPSAGGVIPEWFERQVASTPDATAVTFRDQSLSYAQLNAAANRLAAQLRERGVGPETRVGLCLNRGIDQLVAVLAVLKAGGAFVPLDPAHPAGRVRFMLEDSAAALLLTSTDVLDRFGAVGRPVICLDRLPPPAAGDAPNPPTRCRPGNLAYVIYTSGSTGQPKGVMIEHSCVVAFIESVRDLFGITPADRVLNFASPSFDVSVFEMFCAVLTGARLCVAGEDARLSPDRLTELMLEQRVTVTDLPPSVMKLLPAAKFDDLRIVFVGGEPFTEELVRSWAGPGRRFFNGYGPTECTVTMSVKECDPRDGGAPPIGRPMRNHRCYVLDGDGQPVPIGVPGELCIGGAGLARGYQGRGRHTAERFVPDPFCGLAGQRMYRTGDLVRYLPNGDLVFLGRIDRQVKINGLRIELSEIESVLRGHAMVRHAVVDVWSDPSGHKHLVAWLDRPASSPPLETAQVRGYLAEHLPTYMLPAFVLTVDEIPLTASGKVDRRRLPDPDPDRLAGDGAQPRTETERILAGQLFAPILGVRRVGLHDNFFDLGGNSLQAAQLTSGIRATFGVEVGLTDFFAAPTVAHLGSVIERLRARHDDLDQLLDLVRHASDQPLPPVSTLRPGDASPVVLVHPVGGGLFCYAELVRALGPGPAVLGLAADDALAAETPPELGQLAARYLHRLRGADARPSVLVGWSFGGVLAYEMARHLLDTTGVEVPVVLVDAMPWPAEETAEEPGEVPPWNEATMRRAFIEDLLRSAGVDAELDRFDPGLWQQPLPDAVAAVAGRYRDAGVHIGLGGDELRDRFRIYRNATTAMRGYRPMPHAGRLTVLRAARSPVRAESWPAGTVVETVLPGDHYTLLRQPTVAAVAEAIDQVSTALQRS